MHFIRLHGWDAAEGITAASRHWDREQAGRGGTELATYIDGVDFPPWPQGVHSHAETICLLAVRCAPVYPGPAGCQRGAPTRREGNTPARRREGQGGRRDAGAGGGRAAPTERPNLPGETRPPQGRQGL